MTAITNMTSQQMEARLADLKAQESRHAARDLDAELREALTQGAGVDELEDDQLEAERRSRRRRVEREALEQALPMAKAREGTRAVAELREQHTALAGQAEEARDELLEAIKAVEVAAERWSQVREEGSRLGRKAYQVGVATGAETGQGFGVFTSAAVAGALGRLLATAHQTHAEAGVGHRATAID